MRRRAGSAGQGKRAARRHRGAGWPVVLLAAVAAAAGCEDEVVDQSGGAAAGAASGSGAGSASGSAAAGAGADGGGAPTDCNGCDLLGLHPGYSAHACPGAAELWQDNLDCLCTQCGDSCGLSVCNTDMPPDIPACQACGTAAAEGPCASLVAACNSDTRVASDNPW